MSSPNPQPFTYRGHDILELLKEARNYNGWLADQVLAACPEAARKVVDLGAGCGTFSALVKERGLDVECVDPDRANLTTLRNAGFVAYDDLDGLGSERADFIFTLNVLEHVPDDEALIARAFERLRPGGVFFIFVPAFPFLWSSLDDHVEHQRRYRRKPLVRMLTRIGFSVERARYADSLGFFAALVFSRMGGRELDRRQIALFDRVLFPASRWLDRFVLGSFGKNLAVLCRRPPGSGVSPPAA